jgi:hypothetical protein
MSTTTRQRHQHRAWLDRWGGARDEQSEHHQHQGQRQEGVGDACDWGERAARATGGGQRCTRGSSEVEQPRWAYGMEAVATRTAVEVADTFRSAETLWTTRRSWGGCLGRSASPLSKRLDSRTPRCKHFRLVFFWVLTGHKPPKKLHVFTFYLLMHLSLHLKRL